MTTERFCAGAVKAARAIAAVSAAGALAACQEAGTLDDAKAYYPIPPATLALMARKGVSEYSPVLFRAFKKDAELQLWKMRPDGRYVYIKTYPICRWSGQLGPKKREGDRQVPEGFYEIGPGQMNPNSHYFLSFNVGYPNRFDKAHGYTGDDIMVHGICSSAGCFSMTNEQIAEIYAVAREAFVGGQRRFQLESFPFHMTAKNLAKFRLDPNMPFWRELKRGSDYFKVTGKPPKVGVCGGSYVFDALPEKGEVIAPMAPCPTLKRDPSVVAAVNALEKRDNAKVAALVKQGVTPIRLVYMDGGQNAYFRKKDESDVSRPDALEHAPIVIALNNQGRPIATAAGAAKAAGAKLAARGASKKSRPVAALSLANTAKAAPPAPGPSPTLVADSASSAAPKPFYKQWFGFISEKLSGDQ